MSVCVIMTTLFALSTFAYLFTADYNAFYTFTPPFFGHISGWCVSIYKLEKWQRWVYVCKYCKLLQGNVWVMNVRWRRVMVKPIARICLLLKNLHPQVIWIKSTRDLNLSVSDIRNCSCACPPWSLQFLVRVFTFFSLILCYIYLYDNSPLSHSKKCKIISFHLL